MSYRATNAPDEPATLTSSGPASAAPYTSQVVHTLQEGAASPATAPQASSSPAQYPAAMEELLRENAALKARLQLSDDQRIAQEVLREQLHRFFDCVATHEQTSQRALTDQQQNEEGEGDAPDDGGRVARSSLMNAAVSEVLHRMQEEKQQAEAALFQLQSNTVAPLHARLESLENDKKQLMARVAELEVSMSNTLAPPLVAELKQLRETEALLRQQLREKQESTDATVGTFRSTVEDGLLAARQVPELIRAMEALKENVRSSQTVQAAQRVLLGEMERRHAVEREIEEIYRKEEADMLRERIVHLEGEVRAAAAREAAFASERMDMETQLATAQDEIRQLTQQHSEEQVTLAHKRQRAEEDASSNPSSIRGELTRFWYEGRDQIRELERKVQSLHTVEANLRVSQGRVAQLEQRKATLLSHLATLAAEVDRRREEEKKLRAQCAGVEAERDRLLMSVAKVTGSHLSESELRDCCRAIREAATRVAAASATVVADPQAIEEALRRAQKLKSEVAQLQRQKDQLQRFLELHEDRVRALLEQEALLLVRDSKGKLATANATQTGSSAAQAGGSGEVGAAACSLPQFLEYIRQSANDVFLQNEDAAARAVRVGVKRGSNKHANVSDDGGHDCTMTPHRNSFLSLQQKFLQSQERLLASHRDLLEARSENRHLQAELDSVRAESEAAVITGDKARSSLEAANTALTHRTTSLATELQELQRYYTSAVTMVRTTLEGLSGVLQLYHQSEQHAEKLRQMVKEERQDMSDMLKREAASWGAAAGTEGHVMSAQAAQQSAAAERITAALRDMEAYIAEAIAETSQQATRDQTSYIGRLVKAIQEQEERVRAAKAAFEASAQAQASSLVERIAAAQQQWESTWKAKYQAIEAERTQSVMQQHASIVVQRALEQAMTSPTSTSSAGSSDMTSAVPVQVEESTRHMADTLQVIRTFLAQARQRQAQQQEQLQRLQQLQLLQQQQQQQHQEQTVSASESLPTVQMVTAATSSASVSALVAPTSATTPIAPSASPSRPVTPPSIGATVGSSNTTAEPIVASLTTVKANEGAETTSTSSPPLATAPTASSPATGSTLFAVGTDVQATSTDNEEAEALTQKADASGGYGPSEQLVEKHAALHSATRDAPLDKVEVPPGPQKPMVYATTDASHPSPEAEEGEETLPCPSSLSEEGGDV